MNIPKEFKSPVTVIALMIVSGVLILIGAAIIGQDHGVLKNMADSAYARGLITYLFSVVTVGTAVVLIVSVLTSDSTNETEDKFNRGKEVLSLLLGIFGTIVGFYFGTEAVGRDNIDNEKFFVAAPLLSSETVYSSDKIKITSMIKGGASPFKFGVSVGRKSAGELLEVANSNGWIVTEIIAPIVDKDTVTPFSLQIEDADGESVSTLFYLRILPVQELSQ